MWTFTVQPQQQKPYKATASSCQLPAFLLVGLMHACSRKCTGVAQALTRTVVVVVVDFYSACLPAAMTKMMMMMGSSDVGAMLGNMPSPKKPEEELQDDQADPMWATLVHSGSIKSILEDWTRNGSKSPRASFYLWAGRDQARPPVKARLPFCLYMLVPTLRPSLSLSFCLLACFIYHTQRSRIFLYMHIYDLRMSQIPTLQLLMLHRSSRPQSARCIYNMRSVLRNSCGTAAGGHNLNRGFKRFCAARKFP